MANLIILCDESGTMPEADDDSPFCAAAIATRRAPTLEKRGGYVEDLAEAFRENQCVPFVVFVRPRPGYRTMLRKKASKMNTMARGTRLITGENVYLPDRGHNPRDMIWIRCMAISLVNVVLRSERPEAVRRLTVVLDSKSMRQESRRLFEDRVRSMASDINGPAGAAEQPSDRPRRRVHFEPKDVSVLWSKKRASPQLEFEDGLFLADRLSGLARTALEERAEASLAADLSMKVEDLFYDATPDVVRNLPESSVQRWRSRTGLPEPQE